MATSALSLLAAGSGPVSEAAEAAETNGDVEEIPTVAATLPVRNRRRDMESFVCSDISSDPDRVGSGFEFAGLRGYFSSVFFSSFFTHDTCVTRWSMDANEMWAFVA